MASTAAVVAAAPVPDGIRAPSPDLQDELKKAVEDHPGCDGIILGGHGLFIDPENVATDVKFPEGNDIVKHVAWDVCCRQRSPCSTP